MTIQNLHTNYNLICDYIYNRQLKSAFDLMKESLLVNKNFNLTDKLNSIEETYQNILKHSFHNIHDPKRESIYIKLLVDTIELADNLKPQIEPNHTNQNLINKYIINKEKILKKIDLFIFDDFQKIFSKDSPNLKNEEIYSDIFHFIWLNQKLSSDESELISRCLNSEKFEWYHRCIFISALTISLQQCFDIKKMNILFDVFIQSEEQVWQRAFTGIILCLYQYRKRLSLYPDLIFRIKSLQDINGINKLFEIFYIQLLRSKETEKINKKLNEEILPEVQKLKPKIEDKLGLENILNENSSEEKNPEWEKFFEDTPDLYKKLEELSKLQGEGADVFMSAFSLLKHFDFFKSITNWFIPFYKESNSVNEVLQSEKSIQNVSSFIQVLDKTPFMCNSDKYSFCLNIKTLPLTQKTMMIELFNMEINMLNEVTEEDNKINSSAKNKAIFTQYLQDLYRFYKLYPYKDNFFTPFNEKMDIYNDSLYTYIISDDKVLRNIAEYFFEKDYYPEATDVFNLLYIKDKNREVIEKLAYCYQKATDYNKAIELYKQVEIFDNLKLWHIRNLAFCYKKIMQTEKALELFKKLETLEPDNLKIKVNLGQCYIDLKDFDNALKYYFQVEYQSPKNNKVLRPIAWCSFMLRKMDVAKKYYQKLHDLKEANFYDYINFGHVEWCSGNSQQATEKYKLGIKKTPSNINSFDTIFLSDKEYLIEQGIDSLEISLMLDNIKYSS